LLFWAAKLFFGRQHFYFFEQQNYFFGSKSGQKKIFFWAARIIFLSSKNSYFEQQIPILVIEIRNFGLFREKIFVKMHNI
jgi:hypothetical protein